MRVGVCATLLLAVTLAVWAPTLGLGMIYEDRRDPHITLDAGRMMAIMIEQPTRLLTAGTRVLELTLCGVDASCFHAGNVLLHLVNTALLFSLAWLILPPWGAVAAAVVFALHPIQTEAVAYVSARSDLLSASGVLLAVLSASLGSLPGAVVGAVFASLAKETAIVAWGLVFLWAAWTRQTAFLVRFTVMGAVGTGIAAYLSLYYIKAAILALSWELAGQQLTTIGRLILLVLVPYGFTIDHDWTAIAWLGPMALMVAAGATIWALTWGWWSRNWMALAWLWTLVALSPRLVVPLYEGLHDRHFLTPMIGWALCAGVLLTKTRAGDEAHG